MRKNKKYITNMQKSPEQIRTTKIDCSIDDAIKILKENGYKILKPITEYKEL